MSDRPSKISTSELSNPEDSPPPAEETEDDEAERDEDGEETTPPSPSLTSPKAAENDDPRQVSTAEAESYAKECRLLFFEASAKVGFVSARDSIVHLC